MALPTQASTDSDQTWRSDVETVMQSRHSIVCTDSTMCAGQASGETGTAHPDESFCLIRALFRALELALPPGDFHLHHVRAHAGELFNEIVDTAAKQEAHQSFNLPRQRLDLKVWRRKLLQLWTLIGQKCGLPPWHNGGFDIAVPDLPMQPASTIDPDTQQVSMHSSLSTTIFSCSFASANVQSLYRGPHGHTGKLHYLQEQMRQFQLSFMAVQEARSNEAMTKHNQILRISTGHSNGQYGVELWVDLQLPFCHVGQHRQPKQFRKEHFVVTHRDPQRLFSTLSDGVAGHLDLLWPRSTWWTCCSGPSFMVAGNTEHPGQVCEQSRIDPHDGCQCRPR